MTPLRMTKIVQHKKETGTMKKRTGLLRSLLMFALSLVIMVALGALQVNAAGSDPLKVSVPVEIPGGGTAKIESIDYVKRTDDPENETYAQQWTWVKDPGCLPSKTTLKVPEGTGKAKFEWSIPEDKARPGKAYAFKITQVPGNEDNVIYDEKEYLLEVFIETLPGADGKDVIYAVAQIRDDSSKDTKDYKPDSCKFQNIETRTITRTITYTEYSPDGKEIIKRVVQTVTLQRPKGSDGPWTIVSGDQSAVKSPEYSDELGTWIPSLDEIGWWDIDLNDPQDRDENVYYTPPEQPETTTEAPPETTVPPTTQSPKPPKTGDDTNAGIYIGAGAGALAAILAITVILVRRNKKEEE